MDKKILIIEDDYDLSQVMKDYLVNEGYEVIQEYDGVNGLASYHTHNPILVLLDIMLPQKDGVELCKEIRLSSHIPIIMISAKQSDADKLLTLGVGADDYLTKPFSMIELVARVKSHIRRFTSFQTGKKHKILQYGDITIDFGAYKVLVKEEEINLTLKEFKLLEYLCENPSQVISKEQILIQIWGSDAFIDDNTVAVYINRLREKLLKHEIEYIKTVWGIGYKWEK